MSTYLRNMAWASEKTLWEDALKKAPNSTRAHHNLAWAHYERIKNYDGHQQMKMVLYLILQFKNHLESAHLF